MFATGELGTLGKSFISKVAHAAKVNIHHTVPKPALKAVRKAGAVQAGIITLGLVKPNLLHIYNKQTKQVYRVSGNVAKVAAVVAGGVLLAPMAGPAASAALSAATGFFKKGGVGGDTAAAMAQGVVDGQMPAPTGLATELQGKYGATTASMFSSLGGLMIPIALVAVGGVAYFATRKK